MTTPLRALIVEDSEDDALFIERELRLGDFDLHSRRVETSGELRAALKKETWDVVISDYMLPGFGGMEALLITREECGDIPFIIVSGQIGEGVAVDALKAGADGYTTKDNLGRLVPAVRRELVNAEVRHRRAIAEADLRASEDRYRRIVETATEGIWLLDAEANTTYVNQQLADMLGYAPVEMAGTNISAYMDAEAGVELKGILARPSDIHSPSDLRFRDRDGREVWTSFSSTSVSDEQDDLVGYLAMLNDITARKDAEQALRQAYSREHRIADVLQRALLNAVDERIGPYRIFARYEPALEEAEVGGDFYDVFPLSANRVAVVLGDVSGKGLDAAVHTAMARFMVRAYSHTDPDPVSVLERLNSAIYDYTPPELFVTLFYGVLDVEARSLVYGIAGHELPLLFHSDGASEVLESTGTIAGAFGDSEYGSVTLHLDPEDVLVVYTDGITEAREGTRFFGTDGIRQVLKETVGKSGPEIVRDLFASASQAAGGRLRDDAAVLVITAR